MNNYLGKVKFGEHLMWDGYGCSFEALNSREVCEKALNDLCKIAGMHKLMDAPLVINADSNGTLGGKDPGGYSGFLMIQESHISVHTFAKRGFVTVDLYSCKTFNFDGILEYLDATFKPRDSDVLKVERGLKYPTENIY